MHTMKIRSGVLALGLVLGCSGDDGGASTATDSSTSTTSPTTSATTSVGTSSGPGTSTSASTSGPSTDSATTGDQCVQGEFAPCVTASGDIDNSMCMNSNALCLVDSTDNPSIGVCAVEPCETIADCPCAPDNGDAPVTCDEILSGGGKACFLDCSSGQSCPDDAMCLQGICWFPKADDGGTGTGTGTSTSTSG